MKENKLYESINWYFRDVISLAAGNVKEAREVIEKNKDEALELLKGNYGDKKKIDRLSGPDKEIASALFLLQYRDGSAKDRDGTTNKEFLKKIFGSEYDALFEGKEKLFHLIRNQIINPTRGEFWSESSESKKTFTKAERKRWEEEQEKKKEEEKERRKQEEEEKERAREAFKEKSKDEEKTKKEEPKEEEPKEEEPKEEEPKDKSVSDDRTFDEAMEELTKVKKEAEEVLNNLLKSTNNQKPILDQLAKIQRDYSKRINNMKKSRVGITSNPKLRVNQELILGKSFISRAVYTARSAVSSTSLERFGTAIADTGKRIGKEAVEAKDAISKTLPFRKARQMKEDARAKLIAVELGNERMKEFVYTKNKERKEEIYKQALKARTDRRAEEAREKAYRKSSEEAEKLRGRRSEFEADDRKREEKERARAERGSARGRARAGTESVNSSTDVSDLPVLAEEFKKKLKDNIK